MRLLEISCSFLTALFNSFARSAGSSVCAAFLRNTEISYCVLASSLVSLRLSLCRACFSFSSSMFFSRALFTDLIALPTSGNLSISLLAPIARFSKPSTTFKTNPAVSCSTLSTPSSILLNGASTLFKVFVFSSLLLIPFAKAAKAAVTAAIVSTIGLAISASNCLPNEPTSAPQFFKPSAIPPSNKVPTCFKPLYHCVLTPIARVIAFS